MGPGYTRIQVAIGLICKWDVRVGACIIYVSAANKYYASAGHHKQKNKKSTDQIKFSAVIIKQQIKLVLRSYDILYVKMNLM